jgi:4-amino-4-deoxy-L-arabinose transferase-like glycosyltransferase
MHEGRFSRAYPQKWGQLLVLFGVCFVLFFVNLGQWDLWNPDEPRYAQVSREMVSSGDWILMHLNTQVYGEKPPLFFWAIGLCSFLMNGVNSFAARFPSALFGTLTVLLTFILGGKLYCSRTGFLSGLVLATNVEFAYLTTRANIDATLTFFTTASLLCFIYWYGDRKRLSIYGFYVAMAFATLTKGPVGFLLPLLVALVYLVIQKDWQSIRKMRLFSGLVLLLAIVLCWYLPAVLKGGREYLDYTLFRQTIGRYAEGWSHVRPFYYFFYNFPGDFLPWMLFLPAGIIHLYTGVGNEKRKESLFLLVWFSVIFLFFTFSKGKRELYLLPLYPAASIIVGKVWYDFLSTPMEQLKHEWISFPLYGLIGVLLIGGLAIPLGLWIRLPAYLVYGFPMALFMIGGSIALFLSWRKKRYGVVFLLIVAIMTGGFFYTLRVVFPLINPYKSARYLSQEIVSRMKPGEKLGYYGTFMTAPYNFYTGIVPIVELEKEEDLDHFLQSPERVYCLLRYRELVSLQKTPGRPKMEMIVRRGVGGSDMVLISNQ